MNAPESPSALLRRAADHLEGCAPIGESWDWTDGGPGQPYEVWAEMGGTQDRQLVGTFPGTWKVDNAGWAADFGPQVRDPLIALFRGAADAVNSYPAAASADSALSRIMRAEGQAFTYRHTADYVTHALTLARAILGETGEQP